ncbi:MAG TPA: proline dehydrogenase family protein [Vicinamibacteria bacterium]|nr:proline dehydrogenase family protein [Vicinamibacteria bacterium]
MNPLTIFARRFVAGERSQDAVRAGERLLAKGIKATFDKLGEDVRDAEAARRATDAAKELLRLIPAGLERNISIKMSSMGQEISRDLCLANVSSILDTAKEVGGFVRLDMEGSKLTRDTLETFHELRQRYDNVGIVLQAALHRTAEDVREAVRRGDRVRLCKGAYKEPPEVALQDMGKIREAYKASAHALLDGGQHPAIATHDEELIADTIAYAKARGIAPSRFEFQMLYGLRKGRWESLVREGYNVRIYVPYGTHWIPYFYRRLRERRENVLFVLRNLFR